MANSNRIYIFIIFALVCLWIMSITHKCEHKPKIRPVINTVIRDSLIEVVKYRDSVRTEYVNKWRTIKVKPDSVPCDTFLQHVITFCDTIIYVDSLTIASLKSVVKEDSVIISKCTKRISEDSLEINTLNKKLKRQKIFTKVAFFTGLVGSGVLMYKN